MNSTEDAPAIPVTVRTEYLMPRHRTCAAVAAAAALSALIALVGLNYAGVSAAVTTTSVAALVTLALGLMAYGRLQPPGAVLITVAADTVYLGDEHHDIVSYPLSALVSVDLAGPADATMPDARRLTISRQHYLRLTFATNHGNAEWHIGIVASDPASTAVLARLKAVLPVPEPRPAPGPDGGARIADAGTEDAARRLWSEATRWHDDVLGEYGSYELDPTMLLRYPAVTDVRVEATQDFHQALDEAGALRTDAYPDNRSLADAYQQAVARLRRAWIACETHGKTLGTDHLATADRSELDTALKLYRHAASSSAPAEQATYYGRVREIVARLVDRGVLHPPKAQLTQLESVTRRAIEASRAH